MAKKYILQKNKSKLPKGTGNRTDIDLDSGEASQMDKYNLIREIRRLPTDRIDTQDELQKWLK